MQVSEVASGVRCEEGGNRVRGSVLDHTLSWWHCTCIQCWCL